MRTRAHAAALTLTMTALVLLGACTGAPTKERIDMPRTVAPLDEPSAPMRFAQYVIDIRPGAAVGRYRFSLAECAPRRGYVHWPTDVGLQAVATDWEDRVHRILREAGFRVTRDPDRMFRPGMTERVSTFYALGARVTDMGLDVCDHLHWWTGEHVERQSGTAEITVQWQVFSNLLERTVFEVETTGRSELTASEKLGTALLVNRAFADAAARLAENSRFRSFMTAPEQRFLDRTRQASARLWMASPPLFEGPLSERAHVLRHSVVTIGPGPRAATGSGFFITPTLVMTNAHVVKADERVALTLATGRRIMGEVVRTHPRRDVALLRVEDQGHRPLPVREDPVSIAETVFTAGTPLHPTWHASIRRGTVSRYRTNKYGMEDIQADAPAHDGNSGGPLLDENGNVVGLTYAGANPLPISPNPDFALNLFVPIMDALDKLNVELRRERRLQYME